MEGSHLQKMPQEKSEGEEIVSEAQEEPSHSHDEMYLVWHHRAGNGPDYFSCHHCGFIKVPLLAAKGQEIVELLKCLEHYKPIAIESTFWADELLKRYEKK